MPHIYPLEGQKHFHLTQELTDLGGTRGYHFRLAIAWDGEHFFEVSEDDDGLDLYGQWLLKHGDSPAVEPDGPGGDGETPQAASVDADRRSATSRNDTGETGASSAAEPAAASDTDPSADVATSHATDNAVTEPPAESAEDSAADAGGPPEGTEGKATQADSDETAKDEPAISGTPRKRSAKNSTRRS